MEFAESARNIRQDLPALVLSAARTETGLAMAKFSEKSRGDRQSVVVFVSGKSLDRDDEEWCIRYNYTKITGLMIVPESLPGLKKGASLERDE